MTVMLLAMMIMIIIVIIVMAKNDDIDDVSYVTRMRWSTLMRIMLMVMTAM